MAIPRQIIQIWCQGTPPSDVQIVMKSWQTFHPDFDYLLFDDCQAVDFLEKHFNQEVLAAYNLCNIPAMKADLLRYTLLYKFGGVYIDADEQCLGSLEEWLDFEQSFICLEKEKQKIIFNGFIASEPNHPILIWTISQVVANILNRTSANLWQITGSGTFQSIVRQFLAYKPKEQGINIVSFFDVYRKGTIIPNLLYKEKEHWTEIQNIKPIFKPLIELEDPNFIFLPFVFTGHPRSGSLFISRLLQYYGVNVPHEVTYGGHGMISWKAASSIKKENNNIYSCPIPKTPIKKIYFQSLIHIVRNPHVIIPSIVLENEHNNRDNHSFRYRCEQIKNHFNIDLEAIKNPLECAAFSYVYWYILIFKKRPKQIKLEDADNNIKRLIIDHHIPFYKFTVQNLKLSNINSLKEKYKNEKTSLTEDDVKLWSGDLRRELRIICTRHKYSGFLVTD